MQSAKAAVKDFLSKDGKTDTTVHETVAPTVVKENVNVLHDDQVQTAVDKEVHQDHYHSSVQPIKNQTVEETQHHDNILPVQHKHVEHDNPNAVQAKLDETDAQFTSERTVNEANTQSVGAAVGGEHVHHHVHERIQPVLQQETIQPHVTHTVVPVHEVHHNAAQHHATSALPAVSLSDYKAAGGVLDGRGERSDAFEGAPAGVTATADRQAGTGVTGVTGTSTTTSPTTSNNISNNTNGSSTLERADEKLDGNRTGTLPKVTPMSTDPNAERAEKPSLGEKIKHAIRDN